MRRFRVERVNSAADFGYDTIIVTLPNPPYENENILNKTGGGIGGIDVDHSVILNKVDNDFAKADKIFKKEAYNFIINNPDDFLKLLLVKTKRFWSN